MKILNKKSYTKNEWKIEKIIISNKRKKFCCAITKPYGQKFYEINERGI